MVKGLVFVGPFACCIPLNFTSKVVSHLIHIPFQSQDKGQSGYEPNHTANMYAVDPAELSHSFKLNLPAYGTDLEVNICRLGLLFNWVLFGVQQLPLG